MISSLFRPGLGGFAALLGLNVLQLAAEGTNPAFNAEVSWASAVSRNQSLELFTSEGCSSCPPADRWMQGLMRDRRLWKTVFPLGWHVDYWNDLGWVDPLSGRDGTARQEAYVRHWGRGGAYTPEFVLNGREWRTWSGAEALPELVKPVDAGVLQIRGRLQSGFTVAFLPAGNSGGPWEAHVVLLESGVAHQVLRGENAGRRLQHAFAVRSMASGALAPSGAGLPGEWKTTLRLALSASQNAALDPAVSLAVVGWVSRPGDPTPVQIIGGTLNR
jgi:hypothetical protein